MMIPCKAIHAVLQNYLRDQIETLHREEGRQLKLVTFLIGSAPEQLSFVGIKNRLAQQIGASFELKQYPEIPELNSFKNDITTTIQQESTTGIIIQHPLPEGFNAQELYEIVPYQKEIEGHKPGSKFHFPLSLAVLSGIKYIALKEQNISYEPDTETIIDFAKDTPFIQQFLKDKKVVIAGRGITGGKPIGKALSDMEIPFATIHTESGNSASLLKDGDVIITATGTKIIEKEMLKPGVILLNVGLRKEDGKLKGDYDEDEIQDIASYFTETPGGLGPLDVLYLYKNLLDAAISQ